MNTGRPLISDAWFQGIAYSKTFVTNAPLLEFAANDRHIGDELRAEKGDSVVFYGKAMIPPGAAQTIRLELIEQGVIVASETIGLYI